MDRSVKSSRIMKNPVTKSKNIMVNYPSLQDNAKVKVQYIQNHQLVENKMNKTALDSVASYTELESNEIENVEYLDESMTEELTPKVAQSNTAINKTTKECFIDTFYPNAIHCLISLFKNKYLEMKGKTDQQIRAMHIWTQITQEMNESYFTFSRIQIKEKFIKLRTQYFGISSVEDIEAFEYFDQLHDIYHDKYIDEILEGKCGGGEQQLRREYIYRDDKLQLDEDSHFFSNDETGRTCQTNARKTVDTRQKEIAHKEHEFIDMVEKELQALEDNQTDTRTTVEEVKHEQVSNEAIIQPQEAVIEHEEEVSVYSNEHIGQEKLEEKVLASAPVRMITIKRDQNEKTDSNLRHGPKRFKSEKPTVSLEQSTHYAQATIQQSSTFNDTATSPSELTLREYNTHQERRHQEKLALLRQSLAIQERAIEIQRNLMEELLKRL